MPLDNHPTPGGPWIMRKARAPHRCMQTVFAKGCGRDIEAGEKYAQSTYRVGLDRLELCIDCANKSMGGS